ncbi:hypothetical protein [Candidatus Nitrotoga sp. M5]|nr:hypothetical protein [Candidatus Nitrotoga sp. M5]
MDRQVPYLILARAATFTPWDGIIGVGKVTRVDAVKLCSFRLGQ